MKTPEIRESVRKELGCRKIFCRDFFLGGVGGQAAGKLESEIFEGKVTLKLFIVNTKTGVLGGGVGVELFFFFPLVFLDNHEEIIRVYLLFKYTP